MSVINTSGRKPILINEMKVSMMSDTLSAAASSQRLKGDGLLPEQERLYTDNASEIAIELNDIKLMTYKSNGTRANLETVNLSSTVQRFQSQTRFTPVKEKGEGRGGEGHHETESHSLNPFSIIIKPQVRNITP
jgi:hypothetical protein